MKRSAQERMRAARQRLLEGVRSGLAMVFEHVLPAREMEAATRDGRRRQYDEVTVFWAWQGQIMERNESCAKAVATVRAMRAEAGLEVPSASTAAYCKARARLSGPFLGDVNAMVLAHMERRTAEQDKWHGLVLKALDGSSVRLDDTPENQAEFPQPSGQKPGCGFPVMGVVGVLNLSHGGWEGFATSPCGSHDLGGAMELLAHFGEGDLVLADRAFNSYELVALLLVRGAHSLMRLHQSRARALDWRKGTRIGKHQRVVVWRKPAWRAKSLVSRETWDMLPERLTIRLVRLRMQDRTGKLVRLVVATTLLDNGAHDGLELIDLYARRWEIELKLRDLKTTLRMEAFRVRTPQMARKTLAMLVIAHNLLKCLVQQAGHAHGVALGEMSFKGTLDTVLAWHHRYRGRQLHHVVRRRLHAELLDALADNILDIRPFRQEPRAVKLRPKPYQYLTKHRSVFREIPHKETYRKSA